VKKKKLLSGHKRIGKKFIPPMKQVPGLREMSYIDDLLPELIWLGLINDRIGFVPGARLFEQIVAAALQASKGRPPTNYALISSYRSFNKVEQQVFLHSLSTMSALDQLKEYLAPLVLLYDECPIRFIGPPETVTTENTLLAALRSSVERHIDKYETPGIVLNGMMLVSRLLTKTIHFSSEIVMPDFNAVVDSPGSEEAKRASGFMRANAMAELGMLNIGNDWARFFWNRSYALTPCELNDIDDE
jgi:hypothetical protein